MKPLLGILLATVLSGLIHAAAPIAISKAPFTISQPGEYFLANDLIITSDAPTAAIDILASNVVLNLNGHAVRYAGPDTLELRNGIQARYNAVVRNGRVRGWTSVGILMAGELSGGDPVPGDGKIQHVVVSECGLGIAAAGGIVSHAEVRDCDTVGIYVRRAHVKFCTSRGSETGYSADDTNTFSHSRAVGNQVGFYITAGSLIERCRVGRNATGIYIEGAAGTAIRGSTISRNLDRGITLVKTADTIIEGNTFLRNGTPQDPAVPLIIFSGTGTRVERNRFLHNYRNEIDGEGTDAVMVDNIFLPD